ncbi:hypothetical protein C923_02069 [Plasmodium falciparum UGT5.1]|uniref:Uncharacterized protein n=1 Tax=Plasmodium falciparum UGT5.1 TaxID=1237627 RepID=W7K047_PLAFA|nr:hypothetical protein C923_02069 [Plasmodium falciparum UGT5.1]
MFPPQGHINTHMKKKKKMEKSSSPMWYTQIYISIHIWTYLHVYVLS